MYDDNGEKITAILGNDDYWGTSYTSQSYREEMNIGKKEKDKKDINAKKRICRAFIFNLYSCHIIISDTAK
jgi:hypothetical protein